MRVDLYKRVARSCERLLGASLTCKSRLESWWLQFWIVPSYQLAGIWPRLCYDRVVQCSNLSQWAQEHGVMGELCGDGIFSTQTGASDHCKGSLNYSKRYTQNIHFMHKINKWGGYRNPWTSWLPELPTGLPTAETKAGPSSQSFSQDASTICTVPRTHLRPCGNQHGLCFQCFLRHVSYLREKKKSLPTWLKHDSSIHYWPPLIIFS